MNQGLAEDLQDPPEAKKRIVINTIKEAVGWAVTTEEKSKHVVSGQMTVVNPNVVFCLLNTQVLQSLRTGVSLEGRGP